MGRGVFVGTGVGVGTRTRSLPTEHPRLPANNITSNKLDSDLRLINKLSLLLLIVRNSVSLRRFTPLFAKSQIFVSSGNSCPDTLRRRGDDPNSSKPAAPSAARRHN